MRAPGRDVEQGGSGEPNSQVSPGANIPPNDSPKTQTTSPQPRLLNPANRDQFRRARTSSQTPIPTWIHTAAAPAGMG